MEELKKQLAMLFQELGDVVTHEEDVAARKVALKTEIAKIRGLMMLEEQKQLQQAVSLKSVPIHSENEKEKKV
jgi:hypothetical protein